MGQIFTLHVSGAKSVIRRLFTDLVIQLELVSHFGRRKTKMSIDILQRDGVTILKFSGKIIGKSSNELKKVLDEQLANISGTPQFLLDFAEVSMMDSSGLGTLMGTHVSVAHKGGRIAVINVGTNIKNLIVRSRLITTFEHFNSEDEAIAALTAAPN
jgi:anti-sigma B factor antagonist